MKNLGVIKTITPAGSIIAILNDPTNIPGPKTPVYTENGVRLGLTVRVFGPVKHPYVAIKPASREALIPSILGGRVFFEDKKEDTGSGPRIIKRGGKHPSKHAPKHDARHSRKKGGGYGKKRKNN